MKKILITGGAGFIGGHLAKRLLTEECMIDLIDNFSRGKSDEFLREMTANPRLQVLHKNLLESEALDELGNDYSYIFHLAAIIGVANVLDRPFAVLKDNVAMMVTMLAFARRQKGLKRFLFASTSEVYSGTLEYFNLPVPTPESTPLALTAMAHPRTSYMLSKIYGEALCQQAGVPFTIIRPHNVYGPRMGMAHVIPELLQKAFHAPQNGNLEVYSIAHKRTFCFIDDFIEMLKRAAESTSCKGQTLNVGNQQPEITMGELARFILKAVGKDLTIKPLPATPGSPVRRCPDMSKTTNLSGYKSQIGLEQGIGLTFQWYREHVFKPREGAGVPGVEAPIARTRKN